MITFENSVTIRRPIGVVFPFVADLEQIPKWNYYVKSVNRTSSGPDQLGATFHQIRKSDQQDLRIAAFEPERLLVVETIPPSKPALTRTMDFSAEGDETVIRDSWRLDLGVPLLLEPIAARRAKAGVRENLGKLRELLEGGHTTLQDGRLMRIDL
jgi:uncharacterized protein YndB with AHSA1/START domain